MSRYVMTWRTASRARSTHPIIAASLRDAWDIAFDLAQRQGLDCRGFAVARVQ